jgi:hypothetical protein
VGQNQEAMIYGMKMLQKISVECAKRQGATTDEISLKIAKSENNKEMLKYFLRAANLANVAVQVVENAVAIERKFSLK